MSTRRNEFDVTVDSNGVAHLEIMVEHEQGEIWAKISLFSRLIEEIILYNGDDEVDIKSDVLHGWISNPCFRTLEDLEELRSDMESWTAPEPDYAEICACRDEAMAYDGPSA